MSEQYEVLARIERQYSAMSKNHKKIADYISRNYDQAAFMTAARLGNAVGVSESTAVRFAIGLGYEGYPEFQKGLEECVQEKLSNAQRFHVDQGTGAQSEILNAVLNADIKKLQDTMQNLDGSAFDTAVNTILKAENVYIMGLRSNAPLAEFLHFYLRMIRKNVFLLQTTSISETFEQMIRISDKDCFVGISFPRYSMRTLKAMEFANDRNAKVIAITDDILSPMNLYSSCNLLAKSEMISFVDSLVAPLSVINALIVAMCLKCPQEVKKNLDAMAQVWNNYQIYMNDEMDQINKDDLPMKE